MRVGRFYLKDRLTLADMDRAERLLIDIRSAKVEREARHYLRELFRLLTDARWVFVWEFKLIDKILAAAGFRGDKDAVIEENAIINLTSWLAAQVGGMTPQHVAESMTPNEITPFVKQIGRKVLEDSLRFLRAYHAPVEFAKEIESRYNELEKGEPKPKAEAPQVMNVMRNMFKAK